MDIEHDPKFRIAKRWVRKCFHGLKSSIHDQESTHDEERVYGGSPVHDGLKQEIFSAFIDVKKVIGHESLNEYSVANHDPTQT